MQHNTPPTIITFGTFGPPLLTFVRSCHALGIDCVHYESTNAPSTRIRSIGLRHVETFPTALIGTPEGLELLASGVAQYGAVGLVTVAESNHLWLAENRNRFEPQCKLLSSTFESLTELAGKDKQIRLAEQSGFDVLPTWRLASAADVAQITTQDYPVCLRPDHPGDIDPTFKAQVFYSPNELTDFLDSLTRIDRPVIAQSFKIWPDLKIHGVRSQDGEILAIRAFYVERKFQGVTLTLMDFDITPELHTACENFVKLGNVTGCFHFDLLYNPETKQACYLEINIRMGGVTDKAKAFGYDQPALLLQAFKLTGATKIEAKSKTCSRVVNRRAILRHIVDNLAGRLNELDYPVVGRSRHLLLSLRDLLFACDSVFDRRDVKGSLWFYLQL